MMIQQETHTVKHTSSCSWMRASVIFLTIVWTIFGNVPTAHSQYLDGNHPEGVFISKQAIPSALNAFGLFHEGLAITTESEIIDETVEEEFDPKEDKSFDLDCSSSEAYFLELVALDAASISIAPSYNAASADHTPLFILYHSWKSFLV